MGANALNIVNSIGRAKQKFLGVRDPGTLFTKRVLAAGGIISKKGDYYERVSSFRYSNENKT